MRIHVEELDRIITTALLEDIGKGDLTSELTIPADTKTSFDLVTREPIVCCGLAVVEQVFMFVDDTIHISHQQKDGAQVKQGTTLLSGKGNARSILAAERVALNLVQRMCGIATLTRQYVDAIQGTNTQLLDTRKTTPGLRELEKYAVRVGGGHNHRFRLDDGVLIKDNHIHIAGSLTRAVNLAKAGTPSLTKIEVECDTLAQVEEALKVGVDVIMLDNMPPATIREAVKLVGGRTRLEASGTVSLENIREIAETGVDYISVGKLTHSAKSADIGLDVR